MSLPDPLIDPDDPQFKGKTWDAVEKVLDDREKFLVSCHGHDPEQREARGPSVLQPSRPVIETFPWEERTDPFDKPASCTFSTWRHTCLRCTLGAQTVTLQLNKSATNNTIDPEMLDALQDAIMDLQDRSQVRVVILRSEGKLFSNGFDPKYLMSESNMTENQIAAIQMQFAKILYFWQKLPQLTVALIQGSAMGAAVGLVCACDMVYAVKGAYFAMSETKLGTVATTSIPYITRRITYIKNVNQLVLAGSSLTADVAKEYGIVSEVVEDAAGLDAECGALCDRMTLCAPGAVAATKEVITNTVGAPPSSFMMDYVASVIAEVRRGPEFKSGIEAVQSKRRPGWADFPVRP
mmetsp:Transcript_82392/g.236752  ORF Transcript_82392/g.236752 Transcript_82392/m.236752 type:complete len:351 (-) Transcript_82392:84-1136(-)|eukprot:CAMPEP_0177165470 /NCGR_PEP_ID=MMETSP0367-20130122/7519_1 /TAXON_ID=447022 ORGANISM="Scrippsiella hangoei-like, Strain SHHI-4" /NCGR_SAMPLE_ID=MMETSP0367 /ASSEMBLY_ACC=CAM_ASM_000362 /LENGTH=350 /DNA_ID=CAMNT_0018611477 /DNA_START=75 /DNA_END=1127 /DNA_ORIENTATION=+